MLKLRHEALRREVLSAPSPAQHYMLHMHYMIMPFYDQYILLMWYRSYHHSPLPGGKIKVETASEFVTLRPDTPKAKHRCSSNDAQRHAAPADPSLDMRRNIRYAHARDVPPERPTQQPTATTAATPSCQANAGTALHTTAPHHPPHSANTTIAAPRGTPPQRPPSTVAPAICRDCRTGIWLPATGGNQLHVASNTPLY